MLILLKSFFWSKFKVIRIWIFRISYTTDTFIQFRQTLCHLNFIKDQNYFQILFDIKYYSFRILSILSIYGVFWMILFSCKDLSMMIILGSNCRVYLSFSIHVISYIQSEDLGFQRDALFVDLSLWFICHLRREEDQGLKDNRELAAWEWTQNFNTITIFIKISSLFRIELLLLMTSTFSIWDLDIQDTTTIPNFLSMTDQQLSY